MNTRPPERSRRGGAAIWIGLAVIVLLALAMFGFGLEDTVAEGEPAEDEAVLVDG